ncbi:hypothetical protein [Paracoccus sp. ME4]|uniref:hypothetical protein n=1 Tax=Paracoccus sp. ME4 TaxID=3138066 RepID=UPI00398B924A
MSENQNAKALIANERRRQVEDERWSSENDDIYVMGELERAGLCYLFHDTEFGLTGTGPAPLDWPWHPTWWKPKGRRMDLVRAGALFMAEADRVARTGAVPGAAMALRDIAAARLAALLEIEASAGLLASEGR